MNQFLKSILKGEIQDFIWSNENANVQELLLKYRTIHDIPTSWIAQQILGRRKVKTKLPTWYATRGIVYPPSLNLEQSSSEATAKFKATLLSGTSAGVDLTGGFGVDTWCLSQQHPMLYVEPDADLLQIVQHNHQLLGVNNIVYHQMTAEEFLGGELEAHEFLYLDPSRRKISQKVFKLEDCTPGVVKLQPALFRHSSNILLKTSPLYDIAQGCQELHHVAKVFVVAIENECRELLFMSKNGFIGEPEVCAVDIYPKLDRIDSISLTISAEQNSTNVFSAPLRYLYEPNAAILKAGAFKWVAQKYKLAKLAPSTHLYTSNDQVDFPGRIFEVLEFVQLSKKLKNHFVDGFANILIRNFPLSVAEIKHKTGLGEGGTQYLICGQTKTEKFTLLAERIK